MGSAFYPTKMFTDIQVGCFLAGVVLAIAL
jgi:hypothetical protein